MCGTLTGQRYVDDILRPHVGPFLNGLPGVIFQQDNARPHTARVAQDFLRHFQTLPWPARSPNLSPVEHVWDQLKRQMPSRHSVHDLELAVQDLWSHLPQDSIRNFGVSEAWGPCIIDTAIATPLKTTLISRQKPEKGYECRYRDFVEAVVFRCLSGEIQLFGCCCLSTKCLENVIYWNIWLGVSSGDCDLGKHKELWRMRSGKKCQCKTEKSIQIILACSMSFRTRSSMS
ncbi:DDE_3 domain-containing protein [Trichonephila clavipes]|nr:DDE_3 domain-containing protein [Trichonephila clavipes]